MNSASAACPAWVFCASSATMAEMPMLAPMLRIRLNSAAPSLRKCGARVENATVDSGTKTKPRPSPWTMPVRVMSQVLVSRLNCVISCMASAVSAMPSRICQRRSMRGPMRPTANIAAIVPTPRGTSSVPTSITG